MVNVRYNDGDGFWCTARNVTNIEQILSTHLYCCGGETVRASLGRLPISLFKIYENVDASEQPCKQAMLFVNNAGGLHRE